MKNYFSKLAVVLLALFICQLMAAQNPIWTFPEEGLDFEVGPFNLPTDDYTGQEADYVHAGLKDPYGDIMFFAVDGRL